MKHELDEYSQVYNEKMQCQERCYSHNLGMLTFVIASLTFSLTLFSSIRDIYLNGDIFAERINIFKLVLLLFSFTFPMIILVVSSFKSASNYRRLMFLNIYILVIYEFCLEYEIPGIHKECTFYKSLSNDSDEKVFDRLNRYLMPIGINKEYYLSEILMGFLWVVMTAIMFYDYWTNKLGLNFILFLLIALLPASILTIGQELTMRNTSLRKISKLYFQRFAETIIETAIEQKLLDEKNLEKCRNYIKRFENCIFI